MNTIFQLQQEITGEFSQFNADIEKTLCYLIIQGKQLPAMPIEYKTDEHLIKGCHSKVWLAAVLHEGMVFFYADSNTAITKGLVSLLVRIMNGQSPRFIVEADLYFMKENRMNRFIGNERSNGFVAMISQMKAHAEKFLVCQPSPL